MGNAVVIVGFVIFGLEQIKRGKERGWRRRKRKGEENGGREDERLSEGDEGREGSEDMAKGKEYSRTKEKIRSNCIPKDRYLLFPSISQVLILALVQSICLVSSLLYN